MIRQKSFTNPAATLFLVATPIGNLGDMTYRAVETLKSVDVIFAEDTRISRKLLLHFQIDTPLKSYHEFNKEKASHEILMYLEEGKHVALVSDAGMPIISDPGYHVVQVVKQAGFYVVNLPGANAGLSALVVSGLSAERFTFIGFLNAKSTKRKKELEELKSNLPTLIFYEAPHRIQETLIDLLEIFGDREVCLAREITKKYEEIISGKISEILVVVEEIKGEIVIICSGGTNEQMKIECPYQQIDDLILSGLSKNEAIKRVAKLTNQNRQELYKNYLAEKSDIS